jgi:hypothetical protein
MKGQIFPDPVLLVIAALRADLAADTSPEAASATVGRKAPGEGFTPAAPYVQVSHDGSTVSLGVTEETSVRVAVYHRSDALGLALVQRCRALLLDHRAPLLRSITPGPGPFQTEDPDSGGPLSYLTLSVRTRPTTS